MPIFLKRGRQTLAPLFFADNCCNSKTIEVPPMHSLKKSSTRVFLSFGLLAVILFQASANASDTLNRILARGDVRCGVSDGILGFSIMEPNGRWAGMDVDFCRALAAAVVGDPEKVSFVPLASAARFPSLKAGEIDVLARNTTWTLEREAGLEVVFAGILYYGGQSFLVPAKSDVREISQLNGATICAVKGSTHEKNLSDYFRFQKWNYQPLIVESQAKAAEALFDGRCQAFTSERPQLSAVQLKAPGGPEQYLILPEQPKDSLAKDPMGPVVRSLDDKWFTVVRWVLFSLIRAEETGITQNNVKSRLTAGEDPGAQQWREVDGIASRSLGLQPGWSARAVEASGNYGEMFERNLGSQSALKLERGLNRLYTHGGLMYAPPFR
jgi:general L-amino acid transport system substrate-binding protein